MNGNAVFKRRKPENAAPPQPDQAPAASGTAPAGGDTGLGVPPFRPALAKEAHAMSRPPMPAAPSPTAQPASAAARQGGQVRAPVEKRTLVVGRGISVHGTVQEAERLVVEGTIEATMIHASELSIAPGGLYRGDAEVDDAEVAGTIEGKLLARGTLIVRATGCVKGSARCRRLQVEDGGQITGQIEMITESRPAASPSGTPSGAID